MIKTVSIHNKVPGCASHKREERELHVRGLLVITFLIPLLCGSVSAAGISISQSLDKSSVAFEDSATFEIRLRWDGPQSAYRFEKPLDPYFDRLKVTGFSSSIGSEGVGDEEFTTKTYSYTLVPMSAGLGKIAPVTVPYIAMPDSVPGELITEAMTIRIAEPVPIAESTGLAATWLLILITMIIVAGIVAAIVYVSRRRQDTAPIRKSPQEIVLDGLSELKDSASTDMKKFQTGLYAILSGYLAAQYNIQAEALADEDLQQELDKVDLNPQFRQKIGQWIIEARKDKFRPVSSSPGDTIRLESEVRAVFEKI